MCGIESTYIFILVPDKVYYIVFIIIIITVYVVVRKWMMSKSSCIKRLKRREKVKRLLISFEVKYE